MIRFEFVADEKNIDLQCPVAKLVAEESSIVVLDFCHWLVAASKEAGARMKGTESRPPYLRCSYLVWYVLEDASLLIYVHFLSLR